MKIELIAEPARYTVKSGDKEAEAKRVQQALAPGGRDIRTCMCADPENCTVRIPGYRCKKDYLHPPPSAPQATARCIQHAAHHEHWEDSEPSPPSGWRPTHPVSGTCGGEVCFLCGADATHKVGEEIPYDDPMKNRHNFTSYVCCQHFYAIFGGAVPCRPSSEQPK